MGNAVPAAPGCSACACDEGKPSNEVTFGGSDNGVYPHAAAMSMDEKPPGDVSCREHPEVKVAQDTVKRFVRALVKGHEVELLSVNGGSARCMAFLDRKLTMLSLQRGTQADAKKRNIPLEEIEEVSVGEHGGQDFGLDTDDLCVTVVLKSNQALGFTFSEAEERDTFALCLAMFVDGRRTDETRRV
mmetsp:Transcript_69415/g.224480  ORF Transcript_69415/g.224480 Transcript_69415/m.224480 type:complete len:187 (-) Transcript_69415:144-704(-)